MEADYEPEEASSDESGSSDELSDDEEEAGQLHCVQLNNDRMREHRHEELVR